MSLPRRLGCALVLGCAILAFAGPGAASAANTGLCSAEEAECRYDNLYLSETELSMKLAGETKTTFETNLGTISCSKATLGGVTLAVVGEPLAAETTSWTFGECLLGGLTSCSLEAKNTPYATTIAATGGGDGTLTLTNGGTGSPGLIVVCGLSVNCTLSASSISFQSNSGSPAVVSPNGVKFEGSGSKCPTTVTWKAEYQVQQPNSTFPVEQIVSTKLCKEKEKECKKAGNLHKSGTVLEAKQETKPTFKFPYKGANVTFTCDETTLKLETTADSGAPLEGLLKEWTFSKCSDKCSVTAHDLPYRVEFFTGIVEGEGGAVWRSSGTPGPPVLEIKCDTKTCFYVRGSLDSIFVEGGKPAHIKPRGNLFLLKQFGASKSDADCEAGKPPVPPLEWQATRYEVTSPTEVWVVWGG